MLKLWKKSCGICRAKDVDMIKYQNRSGTRMVFCHSCKTYAEKRSFKVLKYYFGKEDIKVSS